MADIINDLEIVKRRIERLNGFGEEAEVIDNVISLLKEQEPVEPKEIVNENKCVGEPYRILGWECGNCGLDIDSLYNYCPHCGRAVKWE